MQIAAPSLIGGQSCPFVKGPKMSNRNVGTNKRKQNVTNTTEKSSPERVIPWSIRGPLYACAACLVVGYGWGAFNTYPFAFAFICTAAWLVAEATKPTLGELVGEMIDLKRWSLSIPLLVCCAATVLLGMFGSHGAITAASQPADQYTALLQDVTAATNSKNAAQRRVDAIPTCTPEMPSVRCRTLTAQNAPRLAEAQEDLDQAKERLTLAETRRDRATNPGPGIPEEIRKLVPWGAGLLEFLIFVVPLCYVLLRRAREAKETPAPTVVIQETPKAAKKEGLTAAEIARLGWQGKRGEERRRKARERHAKAYASHAPA